MTRMLRTLRGAREARHPGGDDAAVRGRLSPKRDAGSLSTRRRSTMCSCGLPGAPRDSRGEAAGADDVKAVGSLPP